MRLIDADALKEKLIEERDAIPLTCTERYGFGVEFPNHHGQSMRGGIRKALRCMEQTPTIDAVPVVRCKDCKHYDKRSDYCEGMGFSCLPDDFCSYGERKDGDG
jgi:hypothetical protein